MNEVNSEKSQPYLVIARKWRPANFDEVIGQGHIVRTLKNAIKMDRVAHAYLFSGPRGIGKTTIARILAMALNCDEGPTVNPCGGCDSCKRVYAGTDIDCIEIDGASNRGIDEIRSLKERVMLAPSRGRHKVYIIDEVHMLTREAFNALLKTLEEPPQNVVFIFATTEPQKVPETIVSRCQHFAFHRISVADITGRLEEIASVEKIDITPSAIDFIARRSEGALRDAQSLLEKAMAFSDEEITVDILTELLNIIDTSTVMDLVELIMNEEVEEAIVMIDALNRGGVDMESVFDSLIDVLNKLLLIALDIKDDELLNMSEDDIERLTGIGGGVDVVDIYAVIDTFIQSKSRYMRSTSPMLALELAVIRATKVVLALPVEEIAGSTSPESGSSSNVSTEEKLVDKKEVSERPEDTPSEEEVSVSEETDWAKLHRIIKDENTSLWGILNDARCLKFTEEELVLGFPERCSFHIKKVSKPENKGYLISLIEREFGYKPGVTIKKADGGDEMIEGKKKEELDEGEKKPQNDDRKSIEDDEVVKGVLNMFGARIVEIKE